MASPVYLTALNELKNVLIRIKDFKKSFLYAT
jgi:hypothetical protein